MVQLSFMKCIIESWNWQWNHRTKLNDFSIEFLFKKSIFCSASGWLFSFYESFNGLSHYIFSRTITSKIFGIRRAAPVHTSYNYYFWDDFDIFFCNFFQVILEKNDRSYALSNKLLLFGKYVVINKTNWVKRVLQSVCLAGGALVLNI
jgi:hypothetical protein